MSNVVEVTRKSELDEIISNNDKVLVDFSRAEGCVWCKRLAPHFEAAAGMASNTTFVVADVDQDSALLHELMNQGFRSVPTVLLFENGERVAEVKSRTALQIVGEIKR